MSKTVALADWNWRGHHPTYFVEFCRALALNSATVVPFCAAPAEFSKLLQQKGGHESWLSAIAAPVQIQGFGPSGFRPRRWSPQWQALSLFWRLRSALRRYEALNSVKFDLVFFATIYDIEFQFFHLWERMFSYPWSGLHLHSRALRLPGSQIPSLDSIARPDLTFGGNWLKSVAVLDEGVTERMSEVARGRPVIWFPDIADGRLPAGDDPAWGLASKVRSFARGRPIVCQIGYLQRSKGVQEFLAAACDPRMKDVVFVVAGTPALHGLEGEDLAALQRGWEQAPNLWAHLQTVPEKALNALISVSDVVWAAYRDFPNSSNILTKAAIFQKPVVVSDGFLMAERVRRYALGEVAEEGNAEALVSCLERMLSPGYAQQWATNSRRSGYVLDHSADALIAAFGRVLAAL